MSKITDSFTPIVIEISKKVAGKYNRLGDLTVHVPTLANAGFDCAVALDDKGQPIIEDGLPIYKEDAHNFVQGAILAACKAQARNKLVSGTIALKDGKSIAATWEALTAEGERGGGGGAALAAVREVKALFGAWVETLSKGDNVKRLLISMFGSKEAASLQPANVRTKFRGYLADFVEAHELSELATNYVLRLDEACKGDDELDLDDM